MRARTIILAVGSDLCADFRGHIVLNGLVRTLGITKAGRYRVVVKPSPRGRFLVTKPDGDSMFSDSSSYLGVRRVGRRRRKFAVVCRREADPLFKVQIGDRFTATIKRLGN